VCVSVSVSVSVCVHVCVCLFVCICVCVCLRESVWVGGVCVCNICVCLCACVTERIFPGHHIRKLLSNTHIAESSEQSWTRIFFGHGTHEIKTW